MDVSALPLTENSSSNTSVDFELCAEELLESLEIGLHGSLLSRGLYALRQAGDYGLAALQGDERRCFLSSLRFTNAIGSSSVGTLADAIEAAPGGRSLAEERPILVVDGTLERLRSLPAHTLGAAFARFVSERDINPNFDTSIDYGDPRLSYARSRVFQVHDLWHVLLDYDIHRQGEAALAAFTAGHIPSLRALEYIAALLTLGVAPRSPSVVALAREAHLRGRTTPSLLGVRWEQLWERSLEQLREELGVQPNRDPRHAVCAARGYGVR